MLQPPPPGFIAHSYRFTIDLPYPAEWVWNWLNDPKTFTDTQVWPYQVEFYSPDPETRFKGWAKKNVGKRSVS